MNTIDMTTEQLAEYLQQIVNTLRSRRAAAGSKLHVVKTDWDSLELRTAYCGRIVDQDHRASYEEFTNYEEYDLDYMFCIACQNKHRMAM